MDLLDLQHFFQTRQSRRSVLQQLGALAGIGLALEACGSTPTPSSSSSIEAIQHIILACQENRTFDTYFGYYEKAGNFGIPAGYAQPDGRGGTVTPHKFHIFDKKDIKNDWKTIHRERNKGKIDGFIISYSTLSM